VDEVREFLVSCQMSEYFDTLVSNGIDDMEVVHELTMDHLTKLGIPGEQRQGLLDAI
jgi:hypothetical protein